MSERDAEGDCDMFNLLIIKFRFDLAHILHNIDIENCFDPQNLHVPCQIDTILRGTDMSQLKQGSFVPSSSNPSNLVPNQFFLLHDHPMFDIHKKLDQKFMDHTTKSQAHDRYGRNRDFAPVTATRTFIRGK